MNIQFSIRRFIPYFILRHQNLRQLLCLQLLLLVLFNFVATISFSQISQNGIFFQAVAKDNYDNPANRRQLFLQSTIIQSNANGSKVLIEEFQTQSPILNTYAYGNLVDFGQLHISGGTVEYPFLFVVPQSIQYDENTTTYQLTLIFADLLNYDLSNEQNCVSDMSLEAKRFLSYLKRGITTFPDLFLNW